MDAAEIGVLVGGVAAIAWVVWYFFRGERQRTRAALGAGGVQQVQVRVKGGYVCLRQLMLFHLNANQMQFFH